MTPAREQSQAVTCLRLGLGLRQNATPGGDDRVGGQNGGARQSLGNNFCFGMGNTAHVIARQFVPLRRLIDVRSENLVWNNAELSEKLKAAGTGGGQNQAADGQGLT